MSDESALTPREVLEREKARLLEEAAAKQAAAAAIDADLAQLDQIAAFAAKYNLVLAPQRTEDRGLDGSMAGLVSVYRADRRSPYAKLRYKTRENYDRLLNRIVKDCGEEKLADLKAQSIQNFYEGWKENGASIAHSIATMLRGVVHFGTAVLEDAECERLSVALHHMRFKVKRSRREQVTAKYAVAIIKKAHEMGHHSIALAQAFQFECAIAQKDVIGEWVPKDEAGLSEVIDGGLKWLRGLRWNEIDKDLVLHHVTSRDGKLLERRLSECPMIRAEFARLGSLPSNGPIIISETTHVPWQASAFRRDWRQVADAAGVPKQVTNMGRAEETNASGKEERELAQ